MRLSPDDIAAVLRVWQCELRTLRSDIQLTGSPERTEWRTAVDCTDGRTYVLERIAPVKRDRRKRISAVLDQLSEQGVPAITPYLKTSRDTAVAEHGSALWQLMPFIEGVELPRPDYIRDEWRGNVLGEWLLAMRAAARSLTSVKPDRFSITDYISGLLARLEARMPKLVGELQTIRAHLTATGFWEIHDNLPTAFCHGDYHPLNVIWGDHEVVSVLDWEFMGFKPELFDAANMVSCAGMEHPDGLMSGLAPAMLTTLRDADAYQEPSWRWFLDYILALRFAWMREWNLRRDEEMINLELDYMFLLVDNHTKILTAWGL